MSEDSDSDNMTEEEGMLLCRKHRRESCQECGYDFRTQNRLTEIGPDFTDEQFEAIMDKHEADQTREYTQM